MKILIVNYRYFVSGGPEKYMFNLMEKLEAEGHEVINFSVRSNRNKSSPYEKYFVDPIGGMDQVYYEDYRKTPRTIMQLLSRSSFSPEVKRAVKRIIKETDPDVVYILHFINKLSPSVIKGAKETGKKVVVRLSDYFLLCPRFDFLHEDKVCEDCLTKGYRSCVKKKCVKHSTAASLVRVLSMKLHKAMNIYKNVDAFICPSAFLRDKLVANGMAPERVHHVLTFTAEMDHDTDRIGRYGLYLGRLSQEKGILSLLKAYQMLGPGHQLYIVGNYASDVGKGLMDFVQRNQMKNVTFTGFLAGDELNKMIQEARFVCVPSIWYENIPNSVIEAYAAGKPVLCSRIGSMTEMVEDGCNGLLFEPDNAQEIADCVRRMDEDALVLQMSKNARASFEEKYTADAHYQKLMKFLA